MSIIGGGGTQGVVGGRTFSRDEPKGVSSFIRQDTKKGLSKSDRLSHEHPRGLSEVNYLRVIISVYRFVANKHLK